MICGLILAAGEGSRFGPSSKLAQELDGRPVLEHAIAAQSAVAEIERIVVVLGAHADELLDVVHFGRAEPVVCDGWHEGMSVSLRYGVEALSGADRILVTLGDVPSVTPEVIRRFLDTPDGSRAAYDGRPGHPVALGPPQLQRLRTLRGDAGARTLVDGSPLIECSDLGSGKDVDTPQDLEAIRVASAYTKLTGI